MQLFEKTLRRHYHFRGRVVNLREDAALLPNGQEASREVVEHLTGGVCVAALTDQNELLFVRQFRYPYGEELLELPAGKRDSKSEDPREGAARELQEETGATAEEWISLGTVYPSPGYCDEVIWLYLAKNVHLGTAHPDADEFLEIERIPLETAVRMVMEGKLPDSKTQIAVLKTWKLCGT